MATLIKNRYTIFFDIGSGYRPMYLTREIVINMTAKTREIYDIGLEHNEFRNPFTEKKEWKGTVKNALAVDIDGNSYGYFDAMSMFMAGSEITLQLIQTDVTGGVITPASGDYLYGNGIITRIGKAAIMGDFINFDIGITGKLKMYSIYSTGTIPLIIPFTIS